MRKVKLILFILFFFIASNLISQIYFNLGIEEGVMVSAGDLFFVNNILSDLAYIIPFTDKSSLITYYQLKYAGPGIGNSAESKFSERSQDHYFMLKYLWKISPNLRLKPAVNYLKEYYKFGKNEEWGQGLYDLNKYGFECSLNYTGIEQMSITLSYSFQIFKYPNYSDLLTLYLTEFQKDEPAEDYKNHLITFILENSSLIQNLFLAIEYDLNLSFYDNKKVLKSDGYTSNENQKYTSHLISFLPQYQLNNEILLGLNFLIEINNSNQNYIFGYDPQNIFFIEDYYSYTSFNIKPSVTYLFSKNKYLSILFSYIGKKYKSRPAQDIEGKFLNSKVDINSVSFGISYYTKISKYFSISPTYLYIKTSSNNKYQRAVNHNYDAHLISLNLNYEY